MSPRSRPIARKRSPSAPRFTADYRSRRAVNDSSGSSYGSGNNGGTGRMGRSPSITGRSPDHPGRNGIEQGNMGMPDKTEMEAMLRVVNDACRFMDMIPPGSTIPTNSTDPLIWEEIKFTEHTLMLSSNSLLISEEPIQRLGTVVPVRFKQSMPLTQVWCHVMSVQPTSGSTSGSADWIKSSANILTIPKATVTRFGKLAGTTFDGLASKMNANTGDAQSDGRTPRPDDSQIVRLVWIGCPPVHNWLLQFHKDSIGDRWVTSLQETLLQNQQVLEGRSLCVKILNEVTDNQVVYKYHHVTVNTSVNELKEKALISMNIKGHHDCHMLVRYHPTADEERDFLLTDELRESQPGPVDLETFVRQLPSNDPIIPRDQLRVEFVLHARSSSSVKHGKRPRHSGMVKPSDLKKGSPSATNAARAAKNRGKMREKTKSTAQLNTINPVAAPNTFPLRGSRSMGSLNTTVKAGEIFGQVPEELWPEPCLPQSLMSLFVIVYYTGVNVEGIFRRTVVNRNICAMRDKVDENELITPSICPPILAACVLKKFFHEIPSHVLGDENWDDWMEIIRMSNFAERAKEVQR
ncbi:unnamed protein product [Echinostoma caproni]|uniref:Rho-GAP domain-containing protein n=1 Tax=Echinostoma caproni TaxID=27848 RepID=A0A3P8FQ36_9TREM|nr:unnamed protein product [Echinostoma caproni]